MNFSGHVRSFFHALQFLTVLPTPQYADFDAAELSRSARWFPLVGVVVGGLVAAALWLGAHLSPWVGGVLALITWVRVTGGLHLDGLGDVADALGAAHRSPERFLEVLRDPHIGAFGVIAIVLQMMTKLVLLAAIAGAPAMAGLMLVAAWSRWAPSVWSLTVGPLGSGTADRFSWSIDPVATVVGGLVLALLSVWLAPELLAALIFTPAIAVYWRVRLGGVTGDCLGAGTEVMESALLLCLAARLAGAAAA